MRPRVHVYVIFFQGLILHPKDEGERCLKWSLQMFTQSLRDHGETVYEIKMCI